MDEDEKSSSRALRLSCGWDAGLKYATAVFDTHVEKSKVDVLEYRRSVMEIANQCISFLDLDFPDVFTFDVTKILGP